ncbi:MAG: trimethylamine methyltransferase family protein [Rhodobacteraceae bacterium]|nr:trimethylamine methyltransferase family protein [Paracoccaceae bacterium]
MQFPYALLEAHSLTAIEEQAACILDEIGVELQGDPESLEAMEAVGARIEGERVRVDAEPLRALIGQAPDRFVWQGQSAAASVTVGGDHRPVLVPFYGPPNVRQADGRTRPGTLRDYRDLVRFCEASPALDSTGFQLCIAHEGQELVPYMELALAHLELSDKPMMGSVLSEEALRNVAAAAGVGSAADGCRLLHLINLTPPLVYQQNPLRCLRASARMGQASLVTSYMMMGATAPVTVAGALAQGLAEIMVGLALTQIYRPGAPVVGGLFATPFSMQFMGPVFGTPESHLAQIAGCQLVRRLGIPCRGDGLLTSSKINDAQAGYEGASALGASLAAGADLILHAAGWLEFGRTVGLDKLRADEALLRASLSQATAVPA